jgi:tetratricopeptide (TPR) repeat protein
VASKTISEHTRRRLWDRADDRCAFPGCHQRLLEPTPDHSDDTIVGEECHIVAQKDTPTVARAVSLLSNAERIDYAALIEDRHGFENLVLMCRTHSAVIDHVPQNYSVAEVLEMKSSHQETVERERNERRAQATIAGDLATGTTAAAEVRLLVLEDIPGWERKAVARLIKNEPDGWMWLCSQVGEPADPDRVAALIKAWPPALAEGSFNLAHALLRLAEGRACWSAASDVWERLARRLQDSERANRLVCAAVDAKVAGQPKRYAALLVEAEDIDPTAPRLMLVRGDEKEHHRSPSEQLAYLRDIHSDDPNLASMICVQRARAALLIPDVELADSYLEEANELDPESLAVRTMRVNLRVQRARIALHEDREFPLAETIQAKDEALVLRQQLIDMGRFEESSRLLMLAGDVPALQRDPDAAKAILAQALPEELDAPDGAYVLSEAALRVGAAELALTLSHGAEPTDAIRRIRASATIDHLGRADSASLQELTDIALAEGPESEAAAVARLLVCLPPVVAQWDEAVAAHISGYAAERFLPLLRITHLAATGQAQRAWKLTEALPDASWVAELRLRLALNRNRHDEMREAAEKLLDFAPDASGRLLTANAFAKAGELKRAGQLFRVIAHEANASPVLRSNAFAGLMRTLAERDLWQQASEEWDSWRTFASRHLNQSDQRISEWQVRVAKNAPKARDR